MSKSRNESFHYNTLVIGAGPSGLAASYCLKKQGIEYTVLEGSNRVANSWYYVWEDFELAQEAKDVVMVGLDLLKYFDASYHLKRNEIIDAFNRYAEENELSIQFNIQVSSIKKESDNIFYVETNHGCFSADNVVLGLGARQKPKYPACISDEILKAYSSKIMHSAWYQGVKDFPDRGNILVVGSGLSALSITKNLLEQSNVNYKISIACAYSDNEIAQNNHHLPSIPVKLSELEVSRVENFGRFNDIDVSTNHLFFSIKKEPVKLEDYHKIIFATGYSYVYDLLHRLLGSEHHDSMEGVINHQHGVTKVPGLYVVGIPVQGEKTVTITQGSSEAENVVASISSTLHMTKVLCKVNNDNSIQQLNADIDSPVQQEPRLNDDTVTSDVLFSHSNDTQRVTSSYSRLGHY
jgi:thioredoxin reductase